MKTPSEQEAERLARLLEEFPENEADDDIEAVAETTSNTEMSEMSKPPVAIVRHPIPDISVSTRLQQLQIESLFLLPHLQFADLETLIHYNAQRSFCLSDQKNDLEWAYKTGMMTFLIRTPLGEKTLQDTFAHFVVSDLDEALSHLEMLHQRKQKGYDSNVWE